MVALLAEGLAARGVSVTLFTTADPVAAARRAAACPPFGTEDSALSAKGLEYLHVAALFGRAVEFSLIHNHFEVLPISYSALVATPLLTTIHDTSSPDALSAYQRYGWRNNYVAISDASRHPSLSYLATVYPGIALEEFTLRRVPDEYLLFFGRIRRDSGVAAVIEVARRARRRLIIAGITQDDAYFAQQVAPHLDGDRVHYVGAVGPGARNALLGGAYALLHMDSSDEPSGLGMAEAMACGTPVIAYPRGAAPEVVRDGETGWVVAGVERAVTAVADVGALDRAQIRAYAAERFSRERMVDAYLQLYGEVLSRHVPASIQLGATAPRG